MYPHKIKDKLSPKMKLLLENINKKIIQTASVFSFFSNSNITPSSDSSSIISKPFEPNKL